MSNSQFTPTAIIERLDELLTAIATALAATAQGAPARQCVTFGEIVWDDCQCGQLVLSVQGTWPSMEFPAPAEGQLLISNCPPEYVTVNVIASIQRCAPTMDLAGEPPTCAQLREAAVIATSDAYWIRQTLMCELLRMRSDAVDEIAEFTVEATTFTGAQGGCAGSDLNFNIGFWASCCDNA